MSADHELFDAVGQRLEPRGGWHYEPSVTPGAPPSWCLVHQGEVLLGVTVIDGVHSVYLPATDTVIDFPDASALMAWMDEHEDRYRPA